MVVDFYSLLRILGECSTVQSLPALFFCLFVCLFFVFLFLFVCLFCFASEVEISSRTQIPLFMPGSVHCGSAG